MSSSTSESGTERLAAVRVGPLIRELPITSKPGMRVPARVYADDRLWEGIAQGRALGQLANVATLPGVVDCVYAMPDVHEGYGFPVGGVAAMGMDDGVISPGGVGYDINCGVRLLRSGISRDQLGPRLEAVVHDLSRSIPSGTGRGGAFELSGGELDRVLRDGCGYLVGRGLAEAEDLATIEAGGCLAGADAGAVSDRAKQRGAPQLGSIGSGNHFVEVQVVDKIFDRAAADAFGLQLGLVTVLVHTGSRGLGHQVCTDYVRLMDRVMPRYGIALPDRQLACAPVGSPEGRSYFGAMSAAANFAFANRQAITHAIRRVFRRHLGPDGSLHIVYDVAHNMAKVETHGRRELCVHRKGATRAFGPGHPEVPAEYQSVGQPVFIPGSMGTGSFVLAGAEASMALSFGSTCHGAGRALSRAAARRSQSGPEVRRALEEKGIVVRCPSSGELAEEAPHAYKDVAMVVDVVHRLGLARRVARLRPLGVVKG